MGLQENYNLAEKIYRTENYTWDGKSRPNVHDYISPWSKYANLSEANSLYSENRHYNASINHAKTQLQAALKQYEDDLAFWNELDERSYTTPASQSQRYEDAGYNLGYMYSTVDSGNSAVGYDQSSLGIDNNDTSNKSVDQSVKVITTAFSIATSLVKTGYELRLVNAQTSLAQWDTIKSQQQGHAISLQNQWTSILRTTSRDGRDVSSDFTQSLAFLSEKVGYELNENELTRLKTFVKYCDQLYSNQSQDMVKELYQNINSIITDVDSPAIQAVLRLLAIAATSSASHH